MIWPGANLGVGCDDSLQLNYCVVRASKFPCDAMGKLPFRAPFSFCALTNRGKTDSLIDGYPDGQPLFETVFRCAIVELRRSNSK